MKYLLLCVALTISLQSFPQWTTFKIDENFSVSLPSQPNHTDTLGLDTYYTETENGVMYITRLENAKKTDTNVNITSASELNEFYSGTAESIIGHENCSILDSGKVQVGNLLAMQLYYQMVFPDSSYQNRKAVIVYYNGFSYSFNYIEKVVESESLTAEKNLFFSSVTPSEKVDVMMQLNGKPKAEQAGNLVGQALVYLLIATVLFFLGRLISKRSKKNKVS